MTRVVFVGDFLLEQNLVVNHSSLDKVLRGADLVIGNFEGVLKGKCAAARKAGPTIYQCEDAVNIFQSMGITGFTLCNNHAYDYGEQAYNQTIRALIEAGVKFFETGTSLTKPNSNGHEIKIFLACESHPVDLGNGLRNPFPERMQLFSNALLEDISEAHANGFRVIVSVHAGLEMVEIPLSNIRRRYIDIINAGADAVIGHHPHVPQGFEFIDGRPIFYSLGNFLFVREGMASPNMNGMAVQLDLDDDGMEVTTYKISADTNPKVMSVTRSEFLRLNGMLADRLSYESMLEEAHLLHGRLIQASRPIFSKKSFKDWLRLAFNLVFRPAWWVERRSLIRNLINENESYIGLREEMKARGKLRL